MKITQEFSAKTLIIRAVDSASITIDDRQFTNSLVITADSVADFAPVSPDILSKPVMEAMAEDNPELVILGTGNHISFPDVSVSAFFMQQGIGFEVMDTAAACRTYNVLVSEGRKVVAALVIDPIVS